MSRISSLLWNTNPLYLVGMVIVLQLFLIPFGKFSLSLLPVMALVMALAYLQNTTYGLQSRSANRNNNAYHLIAAVAASFTYFWSVQLLVRNDLPIILLAPYVFATIFGTLHGNAISMKIEAWLNLTPEGAEGTPQLMKLWPTIAVLLIGLAIQILLLPRTKFGGTWIVLALLAFTILDSFSFSLLRVAKSTDHYWFHFMAAAFNICIRFVQFMILVNNRYDWGLFLSVTTGSVMGSLIGANFAHDLGKRIKAAFDAHVEKGVKIYWPGKQLGFLALLLVPHFMIFGFVGWFAGVTLLFLSIWQAVSFTMVSRARQRDSQQYLAWASVFSNGVWYLTMHSLVLGNITWSKSVPYAAGNVGGSLLGQNLSMKVEQRVGARMKVSVKKSATSNKK